MRRAEWDLLGARVCACALRQVLGATQQMLPLALDHTIAGQSSGGADVLPLMRGRKEVLDAES